MPKTISHPSEAPALTYHRLVRIIKVIPNLGVTGNCLGQKIYRENHLQSHYYLTGLLLVAHDKPNSLAHFSYFR